MDSKGIISKISKCECQALRSHTDSSVCIIRTFSKDLITLLDLECELAFLKRTSLEILLDIRGPCTFSGILILQAGEVYVVVISCYGCSVYGYACYVQRFIYFIFIFIN